MSDLEITRLCAEAMGYDETSDLRSGGLFLERDAGIGTRVYDPLHDDAQAMALDSILIDDHHSVSFHPNWFARHEYPSGFHTFEFQEDMRKSENRRRARCLCVAMMQLAKQKVAA